MSQFGLFYCIWLIIDMFVYYKFHVCPDYKTVNHENDGLGIILYFIIKSLTKPGHSTQPTLIKYVFI